MSDPYELTEVAPNLYVIRNVLGNAIVQCSEQSVAVRVTALLHASDEFAWRKPKPLQCPQCTGYESEVTDSRKTDNGILRRRECKACGARYKTLERVVGLTTPGEDP
jgi:hypothetical protein